MYKSQAERTVVGRVGRVVVAHLAVARAALAARVRRPRRELRVGPPQQALLRLDELVLNVPEAPAPEVPERGGVGRLVVVL